MGFYLFAAEFPRGVVDVGGSIDEVAPVSVFVLNVYPRSAYIDLRRGIYDVVSYKASWVVRVLKYLGIVFEMLLEILDFEVGPVQLMRYASLAALSTAH